MYLKDGSALQGGRYRILHHISSGGFGCTYKAEHGRLRNQVYAIKEFFVKDFCNRDEKNSHVTIGILSKRELVERLRKKFIEEAQVVSEMDHRGIVKVNDLFEENGTAYYVMDYIDGKSLRQIVNEQGALPEAAALRYIRQVADALAYVHSLDRLHLDVKPGNIMVDGNDNAILIDFGASKHYDSDTGENDSSLMGVNTVGYAPYEQRSQGFTTFSPATDIYSLGATLYKLLSGITPPDAGDLLSEDAVLEPLPGSVSRATSDAVYAAMSPKRKDRPQSIPEFLSLLDSKDESTRLDTEKAVITEEQTMIDDKEETEMDNESQIFRADKEETEKKDENEEIGIGQKVKFAAAFTIASVIVFLFVMLNSGYDGITNDSGGGSVNDTTAAMPASVISINGHDVVDLGLSVRWATCNVGADKPEGYGDYFAWGEIEPKQSYTKRSSETYGKSFGDIGGDRRYDAARARWGGSWRLPTKVEQDELREKCEWTWTTRNGVNGYVVTSKVNGNSIFLPAAGYRSGTSLNDAGSCGIYWSSTPSGSYRAYYLYSRDGGVDGFNYYYRDRGRSVRPVSE